MTSPMKLLCSQWELTMTQGEVGWFSSSAPGSESQPKNSWAFRRTVGVVILKTHWGARKSGWGGRMQPSSMSGLPTGQGQLSTPRSPNLPMMPALERSAYLRPPCGSGKAYSVPALVCLQLHGTASRSRDGSLASRGIIGVPSAFLKNWKWCAEKASVWAISCTAVVTWRSVAAGSSEIFARQKLMRPKMGRSHWSFTQVVAWAWTSPSQ
mmetsp:Transcript_46228/g.122135  ORF Transcript_46228/g.122135 Transcript_46228/m.122135 type:complete len:210 (-) Transcript_46228:248-877(-)